MMNPLRTYDHSILKADQLPFENFSEILEKIATDTSLFINYYDSGKCIEQITFARFYDLVLDLSRQLSELLPKEENRPIAVVLENSPEALIAYAAVMNLNRTLIPIDPNQSLEYYSRLSSLFDCTFAVTPIAHLSQKSFPYSLGYQIPEKTTPGHLTALKSLPENDSVIFTSSGTTGVPKGIVQSFPSLLMNSMATIRTHSLTKNMKHFCILPLFHVNAFSFSFFTSLINRNELILNKNFSQAYFWQTVNETGPQIISLIPPVIRLLTEDPRDFEITPALKYVVSAASNLGKKTLLNFYQKFGIPVIQAYGLSETVNFTTTFPPNLDRKEYETLLSMEDKTSIGIEVWGNNVFLMNTKNEIITTEHTEGELVVRGWNIMTHYFKNPEESNEVFKDDYFHTGDIGFFKIINGQKHYYLSGRKKEIAKINGKLIFLNEIDEILMAAPYVTDCCSVCLFDQNQEEQLGCFLILTDTNQLSLGEIKDDLKKRLPRGVLPYKIVIGKSILLTASGKKRRFEMIKDYFN